MRLFRYLLFSLVWLGFYGCGGNSPETGGSPVTPLPTSLSQGVDAAEGGTLRLSAHEIVIPAASLTQSTTVTATELGGPQSQPLNDSFKAVGGHLAVDLGAAQHTGMQIHLPAPEQANSFPVQIADGVFIPLESAVQTDGSQVVKIKAGEFSRFQVGYVVGSIFPDHKPWQTYNGYVFNQELGLFDEFIDQGKLVSGKTVPNLGENPCVIVHGLGSNISGQEFSDLARSLLDDKVVTGVVGFEYDTLDSPQNNGLYLKDFIDRMISDGNAGKKWVLCAHSMGCIVSREAIENQTMGVPPAGNLAYFFCGPHTGSGAIAVLQSNDLSYFQRFWRYEILNNFMEFTNGDGQKCAVTGNEAGFSDIGDGSSLLAGLNQNAAAHHPAWTYGTEAGNDRGIALKFVDWEFSITLDDGLVNISSANYTGMGSVYSIVVPEDHLSAPEAAITATSAESFILNNRP